MTKKNARNDKEERSKRQRGTLETTKRNARNDNKNNSIMTNDYEEL